MKLQDLINPQLILDIVKKKNKQPFILLSEEKNKGITNALYQVEIQNIPENTFAFSLDTLIEVEENGTGNKITEKARNHFLSVPTSSNEEDRQEHKRINKVCDAILLVFEGNNVLAYFFEMKSGNLEAGKYEHQLINSQLFVDYLVKMYNTFYAKKYGEIILKDSKFILLYRDDRSIFRMIHDIRGKYQVPREDMKLYSEKIFKCAFLKTHSNFCDLSDFD